MTDTKPQQAASCVDPGSIGFVPFSVDVDAICDRPVFGPLWWEYAKELKGPVYLSAPQAMLPDGHPRKANNASRRSRSRLVAAESEHVHETNFVDMPSHLATFEPDTLHGSDQPEHE